MKNILIVVNSTVGKRSNIGYRTYHIYKNSPSNFSVKVICRHSLIKNNDLIGLYPFGDLVPRLLKSIRLLLFKKFPNNKIDESMFRFF